MYHKTRCEIKEFLLICKIKLQAELKRLEENDTIEDATDATPWVRPIFVAPKPKSPNEVRVCVYIRLPNRTIRRERHPSLNVDDIINSLNGAKKFSKLDLRSGYHQLILAPESRYLTTPQESKDTSD